MPLKKYSFGWLSFNQAIKPCCSATTRGRSQPDIRFSIPKNSFFDSFDPLQSKSAAKWLKGCVVIRVSNIRWVPLVQRYDDAFGSQWCQPKRSSSVIQGLHIKDTRWRSCELALYKLRVRRTIPLRSHKVPEALTSTPSLRATSAFTLCLSDRSLYICGVCCLLR